MNGIFWIEGEPSFPLATVLCPRGGDGLEEDLLKIKSSGIETLVSLLENHEAEMLGLGDEGRLSAEIRVGFHLLSNSRWAHSAGRRRL